MASTPPAANLAHSPSKWNYCLFTEGPFGAGIVSAPHDLYDTNTGAINRELSLLHPERPYVTCSGFRGVPGVKKDDVNRLTPEASSMGFIAFFFYLANLWSAARRQIPQIVHEIHGKGDWAHPQTEIAFIGDPLTCGWTEEDQATIKGIWARWTGSDPLVYGFDEAAVFSHQEYQSGFGMAGILAFCGINIELSKIDRGCFDPHAGSEQLSHQIVVLEALNEVFSFADQTIAVWRG